MSIIPPTLRPALPFYLSGPLPCPYLQGRVERKLFTRLTGDQAANIQINSMLTKSGFRRSHDIAYRPACPGCNACVPVRVPVASFKPSRNLKRIAVRNRDLRFGSVKTESLPELYDLFRNYQQARHADSDMVLMKEADFAQMLQDGHAGTRLYGLRDGAGVLLACMIVDPVGDGLSAVYSFYATDQPKRSLGTQLILSLIEEARREGMDYVYLGYWIEESRKMSYKARFQPLQALTMQGWEFLGEK